MKSVIDQWGSVIFMSNILHPSSPLLFSRILAPFEISQSLQKNDNHQKQKLRLNYDWNKKMWLSQAALGRLWQSHFFISIILYNRFLLVFSHLILVFMRELKTIGSKLSSSREQFYFCLLAFIFLFCGVKKQRVKKQISILFFILDS